LYSSVDTCQVAVGHDTGHSALQGQSSDPTRTQFTALHNPQISKTSHGTV